MQRVRLRPAQQKAARARSSHVRGLLLVALCAAETVGAATPVEQGEYVLRAAGCVACHTDLESDGPFLAGGVGFDTPFGRFYSPNITSDAEHGIGGWSLTDLEAALTLGEGPDGLHYYPVFPYTAYTRMSSQDIEALYAYLQTVPGVAQPNRPHELPWFMQWRFVNQVWKWLFFTPGGASPIPADAPQRGAYLVNALAHCGECHTPRNRFGGFAEGLHLAGTSEGPNDDAVPNITPHQDSGIGGWGRNSLRNYFKRGMEPGGDFVGGLMVEVIDESLSYLRDADIDAIIDYLKFIPAIDNPVGSAEDDSDDEFG